MEGLPHLPAKLELGTQRPAEFGTVSLNLKDRLLVSTDTRLTERLTPSEYQVLWLLIRAQGRPVSKGEIERFIYADIPDDRDLPLSDTVYRYVDALRSKLDMVTKGKVHIENSRDFGYWLVSDEVSKSALI